GLGPVEGDPTPLRPKSSGLRFPRPEPIIFPSTCLARRQPPLGPRPPTRRGRRLWLQCSMVTHIDPDPSPLAASFRHRHHRRPAPIPGARTACAMVLVLASSL